MDYFRSIGMLALCCAGAARAQSIKGVVIDATTKAPVPGVLVVMLGDAGKDTGTMVRSDSVGRFIVHGGRTGSWQVRTTRIGYSPMASPLVRLDLGEVAAIRLELTTIAQALQPVQVIERRQLNAGELMSTVGFDLRRERGLGAFLGPDRLEAMGLDGLREVLATQLQPRLIVYNDPVVGDVLRIREGSRLCAPEIFLDGRLLATAPEPGAIVDTSTVSTAMDSLRARSAAEAEYARVSYSQVIALNALAGLTAQELHGIEVYRANEVPPTSLGAWFGLTKTSIRPCGTVAVWTKAGAISLASTVRPNAMPAHPLQVVAGTLLDYETGRPVGAGLQVTLLEEDLDAIGQPAVSDKRGEFTLRTGRTGPLRLRVADTVYRVSTTPVFSVAGNELVIVRLFVSRRTPVIAPLGIASRVQPQTIGAQSRAGFTYRRERAQGGVFLREVDLAEARPGSLVEALSKVPGVAARAEPAGSIEFRNGQRRCRPSVYVDGVSASPAAAMATAVDRVLGVEVYTRATEVPLVFPEVANCGVVAIWTKPT